MSPTNKNRSAHSEHSCWILCNIHILLLLPSSVLSTTAKSKQKKMILVKRSHEVLQQNLCFSSSTTSDLRGSRTANPVLNTKNRNTIGHVILSHGYCTQINRNVSDNICSYFSCCASIQKSQSNIRKKNHFTSNLKKKRMKIWWF